MPSAITLYCFILLYITLHYFILHCTLSLTETIGPTPWGLEDMYHALITCSSGAWVGIGHALITCSSGACEAYAMSWFHAVSELLACMTCPHYMEFKSLQGTCHATTTCNSGACGTYAISSLNAISELMSHMPCPQPLACNALYCFEILSITSYYIAPSALWNLWAHSHRASMTCTMSSSHAVLELV
jgi:hypothetical protein